MTATPVAADHSEEFEQLAGLAALRVLEGDELARFEQHARQCERCRTIVRVDSETLRNLSLAAPERDPSPDLKQRLLARAQAELAHPEQTPAPPPEEPVPLRRGRILQVRRSVWASAIAAIFVIGLVSISAVAYMNQVVASYELAGTAPGTATVVVRRNGSVELQMLGVPDPASGHVYEAWIIPPGQQPVAAGVTSSGTATLPLTDSARGSTVAITQEPAPGSTAPTLPILMAGAVA
jgi:anti-sigma-K factor RskA